RRPRSDAGGARRPAALARHHALAARPRRTGGIVAAIGDWRLDESARGRYQWKMLTFVEVAEARQAPGVRIAVSGLVPSPWSEAAKGLFRLAGVPVLAVRRLRDNAELEAWAGVDNVPVVFCDRAPARTHWAAITELAARLAGPGVLLPSALAARAEHIGLIDLIAGEE